MNITLYKNSAEKNRMYKDSFLGENHEFTNCTLKAPTSFTNPIIVLYETNYITQNQYNYAYIPEFKRYYFVTDIICISKNMWEIHMHVDVLMSWKEKIVTNKALILRSSNRYNEYLDDKINNVLPNWDFYYGDSLNIFNIEETQYNNHKSNRNILLFVRNNSVQNIGTTPTQRSKSLQEPATPCATPYFGGTIYIVDEVYMTLIAHNFGSNANVMSSIIKAIAFPFDLVSYYSQIAIGLLQTEKGIHLTNYENGEEIIESENDDIYYIPNYAIAKRKFSLNEYLPEDKFFNNNYTDYPPYSYYKIHLPMLGDVDIDASDIKGNYLDLETVFDPWTGIMTYSIYTQDAYETVPGSSKCVFTKQSIIGSQLIISFDNADLITKEYNTALTSNIVQEIISGISFVAGAIMVGTGVGAPIGGGLMLSGAAGISKSIADTATRDAMPKGATSGASGSNVGIFNTFIDCGIYFYKIIYHTLYQVDDDNYISIIGRPANTVVTISECHGYLEVGTCHLDNVPALSDELDEITQLLQQGILMPDN